MKERHGIYLLLCATLIWGLAFVFQSKAADLIGPYWFSSMRMILGMVVLSPFLIRSLRRHKDDKAYLKRLFVGASVAGTFLAIASVTQQIGIGMTTAGKAGFITSIYALIVPIFSVIIGKKVQLRTWICIVIGMLGLFMISMDGEKGITTGDLLIIVCAVFYALQIMTIDRFAPGLDGMDFASLQFLTTAIISALVAVFTGEKLTMTMVKDATVPILYVGIFSTGIAYTCQVLGQKHVQAAKATLVLCLESVWAAVAGALILHETMTMKEIIGCEVMFVAVVVSQLPNRNSRKEKEVANAAK